MSGADHLTVNLVLVRSGFHVFMQSNEMVSPTVYAAAGDVYIKFDTYKARTLKYMHFLAHRTLKYLHLFRITVLKKLQSGD